MRKIKKRTIIKRYSRNQIRSTQKLNNRRYTRGAIKNTNNRVFRKRSVPQAITTSTNKPNNTKNRSELESKLQDLRKRYKSVTDEFKEKNLSSYAQIALENSLQDRDRNIDSLSYNNLLLEIAAYSAFFDAETSTIEGIEKINREQDMRLFGVDKEGELNYVMNYEERTEFWSLYDEFKRQNPLYRTAMDSGRIQQILADLYLSGTYDDDINSLFERAKNDLMNEQDTRNMEDIPNVFSGRGYNPYR